MKEKNDQDAIYKYGCTLAYIFIYLQDMQLIIVYHIL